MSRQVDITGTRFGLCDAMRINRERIALRLSESAAKAALRKEKK